MHLSTLVIGSDHYSAVQKTHSRVLLTILSKPPTFLAPGTSIMEDSLFKDWKWGDSLGMIQEYYIYCELYFYYYYISSTSYHQVLDPRGWEPLPRVPVPELSLCLFV